MRIWVKATIENFVDVYVSKRDIKEDIFMCICCEYMTKLAADAGKRLPNPGSDEVVTFRIKGCK